MLTAAALMMMMTLGAGPDADAGRRVFHDPGIGKNGVSCATCHATVKDESEDGDGIIRAGHSLWGVANRKHWRGDTERKMHATLSDAVDVCVQIFMGGRPLEGRRRVALARYLKSISPGLRRQPPPDLAPALEADLDYDRPKYRNGDADAGRDLFYRACHQCHPHGDAGVAPSIAGASVSEVAEKIREGSGLLRGSRRGADWMPFYGTTRLTDEQVADIAAFVRVQKR